MKIRTLRGCAGFGIILGALTVAIIGLAGSKLPYSVLRDEITDAAALPGMLIARVFYPAGVHTGSGASGWVVAVLGGAVVFYSAIWFGILALITRRTRGGWSAVSRIEESNS